MTAPTLPEPRPDDEGRETTDLGKTKNGQPQEPEPSRDATVIVYGASDDLVEVEGAGLDDEFGCYATAGGVLTFNDGTKLRIHYGPDDTACWRIERIATGTAKYSLVVAPDDDEDGEYSDRATLRGDLRSVRFRAGKAPRDAHRAAKAVATQAARASVVLAVDPSRSTPAAAVAPHPAPLGATGITDNDVRRGVCAYNEWDYAEFGASINMLDSRSRAIRAVLENFAARSAPLGATDEGTVETRLIASLGQAVAIHRADRLRATATALVAMVDARLRQGDDPWWSAEQRAVWTAFRAAFTAAPTPDPLREAAQLVIDTWSAEPPLVDGFTAALTALRAALQAGG